MPPALERLEPRRLVQIGLGSFVLELNLLLFEVWPYKTRLDFFIYFFFFIFFFIATFLADVHSWNKGESGTNKWAMSKAWRVSKSSRSRWSLVMIDAFLDGAHMKSPWLIFSNSILFTSCNPYPTSISGDARIRRGKAALFRGCITRHNTTHTCFLEVLTIMIYCSRK